MSLSSLIVQREVATMRQVEEALAHQVLYGCDLATNLLETASVDEKALTSVLAEAAGLTPAPSGELPVGPERAGWVASDLAISCAIVPLELAAEVLVVAVAEPLAPNLEEQLMFSVGVAVEQRVACAVRVRQAIARLYGVPLERRMQRLLAKLSGAPGPSAMTTTPPLGSPKASEVQRGQVRSSGNADVRRSTTPPIPSRYQTASGFPAAPAMTLDAQATLRPNPKAADSLPPSTPLVAERRGGLLRRDAQSREGTRPRRRGPITFDAGKLEAEDAADRDALLDLFFDFSRQFFDYTALFLVHGDIAEGRDAFGSGASRERVSGIGVPLDLPSLMSRARDERIPIVTRAVAGGLDAVLLSDLQRPRDAELAVVPLVVRTRAVAILVGDCAEAPIDAASQEQITEFSTVVGKALERVVVRRKLRGFVPVGKASMATQTARPSSPRATPSQLAPPSPRPTRLVSNSLLPPPPAANLALVRQIGGPPIPREEPESARRLEAAPDNLLSDLDIIDSVFIDDRIPEELDARALFDILGWETGAEEPEVPPPSSALALAPHLPPAGHTTSSDELPSVIVDLNQELAAIVERAIGRDGDESAEGELLRQGERAMGVIMARFPGPVNFEFADIVSLATPPRATECGPLLRLIVRQRKVALPFVLERLSDPDPNIRGWATHVLCELRYEEAIPYVIARLRDPDEPTSASAMHAISAISRVCPDRAREAVKALSISDDPRDRAVAMGAMARLRQGALVPDLVGSLSDPNEHVAAAARAALIQLTWQDFGVDGLSWLKWWEENASRHRIEWLIDGLSHDVPEIRRGAGDELRALTRQYFGYSGDLPARDRDRSQQRYRDWWITEGRARFRGR